MNCIYCQKPIIAGMVTNDGEIFKCIYCNIWFKEVDEKLVKIEHPKLT